MTDQITEYEKGFIAGRKSLQPKWISAEEHPPKQDGIYFAVIEDEDGSFSIGLYEMFAGGSWLVDKKRKVRYWAEQSSYDLPEELFRKGIAQHVRSNQRKQGPYYHPPADLPHTGSGHRGITDGERQGAAARTHRNPRSGHGRRRIYRDCAVEHLDIFPR